MDEIIVVAGPTASGKTAFAIREALKSGAEIVSADSVQVYRHMDIGTAKPTPEERKCVRHHMIDVTDPNERFSVADYQRMANECIDEIASRGKGVIVVGGTGLYISALIYNIKYPDFAVDHNYREKLIREADSGGLENLHKTLAQIDPAAAGKIHANDKKRVIRALEVYHATGRTISEHERVSRATPPSRRFKLIGLDVPRDELYHRIDARVDAMFAAGLADEARSLFERYGAKGALLSAIGYKELLPYYNGECTFDEALQKIKMETRRYAKRQLTWFRNVAGITWINNI